MTKAVFDPSLGKHGGTRYRGVGFINTKVRDTLGKFYYEETKRRPMILPFMVKV